MVRRTAVGAVVAAACVATVLWPAPRLVLLAPLAPSVDAPAPYRYEVQFREQVGLPYDMAYVLRLHDAERAGRLRRDPKYRILLTPEERRGLDVIDLDTDGDAAALSRWIGSEGAAHVGGFSFDASHGRFVVLVTEDVAGVRAELSALLKDPRHVDVRRCRWSYGDFRAIQERLDELDEGPPLPPGADVIPPPVVGGVHIVTALVDERRNVLTITVSSDVEEARRVLPWVVPAEMIQVAPYVPQPTRRSMPLNGIDSQDGRWEAS